ncbi:MAG: hypothetical protein IT581_04950 [Verrucomicrobiales bacterium]|nr:hypothetical protein [Verrucomicrobiales bacterium]
MTPSPSRREPCGPAIRWVARLVCFIACLGGITEASSVRQFDLAGLCKNAHLIYRGTVLDATPSTLNAGGGTIPIVTYRIQVKEMLAGAAGEVIELRSLRSPKPVIQPGGAQWHSPLDLPELSKGKEYLLFSTRPSRIGLSTLVGLGQGLFSIQAQGNKEVAVNRVNNVGLGLPANGPMDYQEMADHIRRLKSK